MKLLSHKIAAHETWGIKEEIYEKFRISYGWFSNSHLIRNLLMSEIGAIY